MPDYSKSSEYIVRDVFSTGTANTSAAFYSTEQIIRAVYDSSLSALTVNFTIANDSLKVNY